MSLSSSDITTKLNGYITCIENSCKIYWNKGITPSVDDWGFTKNECTSTCTSNEFSGGEQCNGFARFIAYLLTGTKLENVYGKDHNAQVGGGWIKKSNLSDYVFCPGDVVEVNDSKGEHSAVVLSSDGTNVSVLEVWGTVGCQFAHLGFNGGATWGESTVENIRSFASHVIKCPSIDKVFCEPPEVLPDGSDTGGDDSDEGDNTPKVDITYKRNINADGGPDEVTKTYNVGAELRPLPVPEPRKGYEFVGWYTAESSGGKYENYSIARSDIHTIWAHWSYPVTMYYCNGSGGYETRNAVEKSSYGDNFLADPPAGAMPSNYRFDGWYTAESGGTKINSSGKANGTNVLYAHWIETVDVKFMQNVNADGGPVVYQRTYDVGDALRPLPTIDDIGKREGYDLIGWYTSSSGGGKYEDYSVARADRTQIWAHWQYDIELYLNEGDTTPVSIVTAQTGNTYGNLVSTGMYTKCGYDHIGWAYDEKRTKECNLDDYVDNKTNKLYAIWEAKKMKVTYNYGYEVNGTIKTGEGTLDYGDTYADATGTNVPNMSGLEHPTGGYEFSGWHHDVVEADDTVVMDADHTLTAMWEPKKIIVTFRPDDTNSFKHPISSIQVRYGDKFDQLPVPDPVLPYEFIGWTLSEDGESTGTYVNDFEDVYFTEDITLMANWSKRRFVKFIYENENGEETTKGCSQMYGYAYRGVPTIPEKAGYTSKWVFSEEGSAYDGAQFFSGMLVIPDHPDTIRAVYTAVTTD